MWTFGQAHAEALKTAARLAFSDDAAPEVKDLRREVHRALKQATFDYDRIQYNTVVSAGMKMLNAIEAAPADAKGALAFVREGMSILIRVLYPVVPHVGSALWQDLGYAAQYGNLLDAPWPQVDPAALAQDEIELVVQVNGKLRGKLVAPSAADKGSIEALARSSPVVLRYTDGLPIKRVVVIPGKLVNVVV